MWLFFLADNPTYSSKDALHANSRCMYYFAQILIIVIP